MWFLTGTSLLSLPQVHPDIGSSQVWQHRQPLPGKRPTHLPGDPWSNTPVQCHEQPYENHQWLRSYWAPAPQSPAMPVLPLPLVQAVLAVALSRLVLAPLLLLQPLQHRLVLMLLRLPPEMEVPAQVVVLHMSSQCPGPSFLHPASPSMCGGWLHRAAPR